MTEKEAQNKFCFLNQKTFPNERCLGSLCMHWRWEEEPKVFCKKIISSDFTSEDLEKKKERLKGKILPEGEPNPFAALAENLRNNEPDRKTSQVPSSWEYVVDFEYIHPVYWKEPKNEAEARTLRERKGFCGLSGKPV